MESEVIKTQSLCKQFGKVQAIEDLTVAIKERSITGLVGRNGSGKTTLLKILAGRLNRTSGDVLVFGAEPMDNIAVQNRLVYTCHNVEYEQRLSLNDILYAYKTAFPRFDNAFAERLMSFFELNGKTKYTSLSQGMAAIFNFLCAMACRCELTMFDEPVLGMDVTVRKSAYEILLRDFSEHPRTFIISSHLLSEIEGVLSDILLIEKGRLVLHNSIDDVRQSAYRVDGSAEALDGFVSDKDVIAREASELKSFAVVLEPLTEQAEQDAKARGLAVSPVRAEDLCVYLTRKGTEDELKCLWK